MSKFTKKTLALVLAVGLMLSQTICAANASGTLNADGNTVSETTRTREQIILHSAADALGKTPQELLDEIRSLRNSRGLRAIISGSGMSVKDFIDEFKTSFQSYSQSNLNRNTDEILNQAYLKTLAMLEQYPSLAMFLLNRTISVLSRKANLPAPDTSAPDTSSSSNTSISSNFKIMRWRIR